MPQKKSLFFGLFGGFALAFFFFLRYSPFQPEFFTRKIGVFPQLVAGLDPFEVDRQFRRIGRINGS